MGYPQSRKAATAFSTSLMLIPEMSCITFFVILFSIPNFRNPKTVTWFVCFILFPIYRPLGKKKMDKRIIDFFGTFGTEASEFFSSLLSRLDPRFFLPPVNNSARTSASYWHQCLSVLLWSGHATSTHQLWFKCSNIRPL